MLTPAKLISGLVTLLLLPIVLLLLLVVLIAAYHIILVLCANTWGAVILPALPTFALIFAVCVIELSHPVQNLLSLIVVFLVTVFLFLYAKAEFLALTFLIVYVGAIAILFLFVVMLLNIKELTATKKRSLSIPQLLALHSATPLTIGFCAILFSSLNKYTISQDFFAAVRESNSFSVLTNIINNQFTDIFAFSTRLYTTDSCLFMLVTLLLLTAMVGAIVLATSTVEDEEPQRWKFFLPKTAKNALRVAGGRRR